MLWNYWKDINSGREKEILDMKDSAFIIYMVWGSGFLSHRKVHPMTLQRIWGNIISSLSLHTWNHNSLFQPLDLPPWIILPISIFSSRTHHKCHVQFFTSFGDKTFSFHLFLFSGLDSIRGCARSFDRERFREWERKWRREGRICVYLCLKVTWNKIRLKFYDC